MVDRDFWRLFAVSCSTWWPSEAVFGRVSGYNLQKLAKAIQGAGKTKIDTRAVRQIVHDHIGDRRDDVNHDGITVKQIAVGVKVIEHVAEDGGESRAWPFVHTRKAEAPSAEVPMVSEPVIRAGDAVPVFRLR